MAALGASRHMPAERLGPAGLDRRHDLELGQADMPGIGPPPRGAVGAEDVSDLQRGPGHVIRALLQPASQRLILKLLQRLERADRAADRLGGNVGIDRGGIEPGMPEQPRVIMLTFYVIENQSAVERDRLLADAAGHSARDRRRYPSP